MAIDKRFLYYTSEDGFLSDKNDGNISDSSIAFISVGGKKAIYTHGVFFSSEAFVVGTQTAATNAFTGTLNEIEKLYDGLSIKYWLPENGTTSNATLNLNINGTQTGAIPVYIKGTTRFTNHIGKYNVLHLTYRENVESIEKGWWVLGSFGDKADGDTKYSFTSGTDGSFKVKASDGSAEQTISIGKPEEAGTADVAKKVEKAFTLQVNSGSTEYEDLYTFDGSTAKTVNIRQGSNIKIETADGEVSISGNYSAASQSAAGLMSAADKKKLDKIEESANKYTHPIHTEVNNGFVRVTVDAEGHVSSTTDIKKSDITALGIPGADTHYSSKNVVGSSTATSNTTIALSNGKVYLNSVENGAVTSSHKISGSGNTTVKTDASGNIEINSPTTVAWGSVTGKPTEFTPSAHTHSYTELTGSVADAENQAIVSDGNANGWKLYTLRSAAQKTASTSISSSSTDSQVPTAKAVYTAITTGIKANDAMIFKGTLGTGGTVTALPASHEIGDTYRVITAGSYAGVQCEIGDLVICITAGTAANNAHWTVAQTNIDGAVTGPTSATNNHVVVFNGTSGRVIKSSGFTLGCSVPADAKFTDTVYTHPSFTAKTSGLYKITVNNQGHVTATTAVAKADITALGIPGSDTTYGIGDYDTSGLIKPWKSYTKASTGPTAATSDTAVAVNGITATSGRYYAVEMDSAGRAFVNVPWTDNNTDTKVKQTSSTTNAAYPILTATTASPTSGTAYESYYNTGVTINPSTKTITATTFSGALSGNASSATYASNVRITDTTSAGTYYPTWTAGRAANTNYILRGNSNFRYNIVEGTTSAEGFDSIYLGNSTAKGTAKNSTGKILLYSSSSSYHTIVGDATTSTIAHTLPATAGTILNTGTTGITAVQTSGAHIATIKINSTETKLYAPSNPSLALGTTATTATAGTLVSSVAVSGHTVTMTKYSGTIGSTTKPAYFNAGVPTVCSTYAGGTKVTFNGADKGASTASFYAPIAAGTSGQVLVSSGGAPEWKDFDEVGLKTGTVTKAITTSWASIVTAANMATYCPEAGTYAIQVSGSSIGISSGIFSWNSSGSTNDEILLHRTGASTNIYLRLSNRALQIAGSVEVASGSISIKVKRLI